MGKELAEVLVIIAELDAVKEFEKFQKDKRVRMFQNTKKLMENYNRICQSVGNDSSELFDMHNRKELGGFTEKDIFINSKLRSIVMITHIEKCLKFLEEEMLSKDTMWKYEAFKDFYLSEETQENIAERLNTTDRTVRRWISELTGILSIYLFGWDAILLD